MKKNSIGIFLCFLLGIICIPQQLPAQEVKQTAANPVVVLSTNAGNISIELDQKKAPITVENFLKYVETGFYNNTVFHRVIPKFMIQGGGFSKDMIKKPTGPAIKNEAKNGLSNKRGSVAMARTSSVNSATAQFFINLSDNIFLDHGVRDYGYAVFGKVISGMDIVDAIAREKTATKSGLQNVPVKQIIIEKVTLK